MQITNQKKEIIWNLVNSFLAGLLVMLGGFSTGIVNSQVIIIAVTAGLIVFVTKFKEYWLTEEMEYKSNRQMAFNFL